MTARIKDNDIEHLSWIYDRLANVHSENTNFDYMHKLNAIIANLKLDYAYYGDLVLHREAVRPGGELIETPEAKEALDAIKQVEWDGEGLPPVGVECEIYCPVNPVSPDGDKHWAKTEIVAIIDCGFGANTTVVYKTGWSGDWYVDAHPSDLLKFRKPETPEANKVREAVENLHDASQQAESLTLRETLAHETLDKSVDEQLKTYRYEKVTDSIFDLKEEFERGELHSPWSAPDDIEYHPISDDESVFISVYMHEELYRRIEIDPIEELAKEFHQIDLNHKNSFTKWDDLDRAIIDAYLEMAKHAIEKHRVK